MDYPADWSPRMRREAEAMVAAAGLPSSAPGGVAEEGEYGAVRTLRCPMGTDGQWTFRYRAKGLAGLPEGHLPVAWSLRMEGRRLMAVSTWGGPDRYGGGRNRIDGTMTDPERPLPDVDLGEFSSDPVALPAPPWAYAWAEDPCAQVGCLWMLRDEARAAATAYWESLDAVL